MVTLGARLKELRNKNKWTQQKVAEQLGVTRSAYSQYELNTKSPTIDTLKKLAEIYQTSIDYIVGRY